MKIKKLLAVIAIVMTVAMLFTACGGDAGKGDDASKVQSSASSKKEEKVQKDI